MNCSSSGGSEMLRVERRGILHQTAETIPVSTWATRSDGWVRVQRDRTGQGSALTPLKRQPDRSFGGMAPVSLRYCAIAYNDLFLLSDKRYLPDWNEVR